MNVSRRVFVSFIFYIALLNVAHAQQTAVNHHGDLFSAGYAAAFIGGLYDGFYPNKNLSLHGDFGLGAPDKMDGELIMLNGKLYQARATGKVSPMDVSAKTPYAVVCFFHAKKIFKPGRAMDKAALFHYIDSVLSNVNGMYAIRIKGKFGYIKVRAFPLAERPYQPLASMLGKQHFFEFRDISGDLVGYRLPAFLEGQFISGYHFHFLSEDKNKGGHIIDLQASDVVIEVDELNNYTMVLPQTADFRNMNLNKDRTQEIKSVETGKKQ